MQPPRTARLLALALVAPFFLACSAAYDHEGAETEMQSWDASMDELAIVNELPGDVSVTAVGIASIDVATTRTCLGRTYGDMISHMACVVVNEVIQDGTLSLTWTAAPGMSKHAGAADLDVFTPATVPVQIDAEAGNIAVRGLSSSLDLFAADGDVLLDAVAGDLTVEANGTIEGEFTNVAPTADLWATGNVVLVVPADTSVTFDVTTARGEITLDGFDELDLAVDEPGRKAGTIGDGAGAVQITVAPEHGPADVTIRAAT